jgi:hypothetical protein
LVSIQTSAHRNALSARRGFGLCAAAFAATAAASGALAEPRLLTGEALRDAVLGSTVEIDTPIGTTVPVKIGQDGALSGDAGNVSFILGSQTDHGRWWIEKGQLCQRWTTWFHGDKSCLRIVIDGTKIAWERDDGETGTATLYPRAEDPKPQAVALASREGPRSGLGGPAPEPEAAAQAVAEPQRVIEQKRVPDHVQAAVQIQAPPSAPVTAVETPQRQVPGSKPAAVVRKASFKSGGPLKVVKHKLAQAAATAPSFWVNGVDEDDVLNIRQGPSAEAPIVGEIPPMSRGVQISGSCDGLWCPVRFRKYNGWVNRAYLVYEVPGHANTDGSRRQSPSAKVLTATSGPR